MAAQRNDELLDNTPSQSVDPGTLPSSPGKRSLTSGLAPSANSVAREVVRLMRKEDGARDANGVATNADAAVDRASSSAGAPLPDDVRTKFEGSLGADLSAVRVHTGAESAAAAKSVGAQAYTVGSDIHFGEGKYAPADPFGVHLLAHEVAHTVQQHGAAPARQHKLEISAPGDAAEVEADRAADAMVQGARAAVTSGASSILRRDVVDNMKSQARVSAQDDALDFKTGDYVAHEELQELGAVNNVTDAASAKQMIGVVKAEMGKLQQQGRVSAYLQNVDTLNQLSLLADTQSMEVTGLSRFTEQYRGSVADFARIEGAVGSLRVDFPTLGAAIPAARGGRLDIAGDAQANASDLIGATKKATGISAGDVSAVGKGGGDLGVDQVAMAQGEAELNRSAKEANDAQDATHRGLLALQSATQKLNAKPGRAKNDKDNAEVSRVTQQMASTKGLISTVFQAAGAFFAVPAVAEMKPVAFVEELLKAEGDNIQANLGKQLSEMLKKGGDTVKADALDLVIGRFYSEAMNTARMADGLRTKVEDFNWDSSFATDVELAKTSLSTSVARYKKAMADVQRSKDKLRGAAEKLGAAAASRTGKKGFRILGVLLGEVEAFLSQSEITEESGRIEKEQAAHTDAQRRQVMEASSDGGKKAMVYFSWSPVPDRWPRHLQSYNGQLLGDDRCYVATNRVYLSSSADRSGGARDHLLQDLAKKKAAMSALGAEIRAQFNLA